MKKTILAALLIACASAAFAEIGDGWYITGSAEASVMAAPSAAVPDQLISPWTNGTAYAQGEYVFLSGTGVYWTATGGTSTNAPSHSVSAGTIAGDDGVYWKKITSKKRKLLIVHADLNATGTPILSYANAVRMGGDPLDALRSSYVFYADETGEIYIKGAGTFYVSERK